MEIILSKKTLISATIIMAALWVLSCAHSRMTVEEKAFRSGIWAMEHNRYEEAIEYFQQTILENPDNADAYYSIATCYQIFNQYPQSLDAIKKTL